MEADMDSSTSPLRQMMRSYMILSVGLEKMVFHVGHTFKSREKMSSVFRAEAG